MAAVSRKITISPNRAFFMDLFFSYTQVFDVPGREKHRKDDLSRFCACSTTFLPYCPIFVETFC